MNLMNKLMLSCLKATELMERKQLRPLSFMENMQLHLHTTVCSGCRNYLKQTALINKLLDKNFNSLKETDTTTLEEKILSKCV